MERNRPMQQVLLLQGQLTIVGAHAAFSWYEGAEDLNNEDPYGCAAGYGEDCNMASMTGSWQS